MRREDVLIINDGTPFLQTIGQILESRGHRISLTDNPEDSLLELAEKYFNLVIVKLSGKDRGYLAALGLVKQLNPEAKLMVLGDGALLPVEAFKGEVDDYILLPCRPVEVWRRLKGFLKPAGPAARPGAGPENLDGVNGRVLNQLDRLFHDLRDGLVSLNSALRLAQRRSGGKTTAHREAVLAEAQEKTHQLEALLENFLRGTVFNPARGAATDALDLGQDVVAPVPGELQGELQQNHSTIDNHLDFLPAYLGMTQTDGSDLHVILPRH